MASIPLPNYNEASWQFTGKSVRSLLVVPRLNCRPAKEVFNSIHTLITSQCISLDECEPKIKSYHKHGSTGVVFETIPGIGLGCEMVNVTYNFTRRSNPSDAGNTCTNDNVRATMFNALTDLTLITGKMLGLQWFPFSASGAKGCPEV